MKEVTFKQMQQVQGGQASTLGCFLYGAGVGIAIGTGNLLAAGIGVLAAYDAGCF